MLAEKFILFLEALMRSDQYPDGSFLAKTTSSHVPLELPSKDKTASASRTLDRSPAPEENPPTRTTPAGEGVWGHNKP